MGSETFLEDTQLLVFPAVVHRKGCSGSGRDTHIPELYSKFTGIITEVEKPDGQITITKCLNQYKGILFIEPVGFNLDTVCSASFRVLVNCNDIFVLQDVLGYLAFAFGNFLFEIGMNAVLSPVLVRLLDLGGKRYGVKRGEG